MIQPIAYLFIAAVTFGILRGLEEDYETNVSLKLLLLVASLWPFALVAALTAHITRWVIQRDPNRIARKLREHDHE